MDSRLRGNDGQYVIILSSFPRRRESTQAHMSAGQAAKTTVPLRAC